MAWLSTVTLPRFLFVVRDLSPAIISDLAGDKLRHFQIDQYQLLELTTIKKIDIIAL